MQDKRAAPRWRLKQSEQRALLILGDLIAGYLALLVALYLWAAEMLGCSFRWNS